MSLHSWLQNIRSALASGRGQRKHARRGPKRAPTYWPNLAVLEDRSVPAFLAPVDSTVGWYPYGPQAGDFNGDGRSDLVAANRWGNSVSVLLGNGDGTFQPPRTPSATGSLPLSLVVGDFNQDSKLDLATANGYSPGNDGVTILLGNGDGTFVHGPGTGGEGFEWADAIATGDLNGDGTLDLVTTSVDYYGTSYISALIGHGDGTFTPHTSAGFGPYFTHVLALADFDGDGSLDLVAGSYYGSALMLRGNGDGTFQSPNSDLGVVATSLAVTDLDGDGNFDIAATTPGPSVGVLRGKGDGTFQPAQFFPAGVNLDSVNAADVSGDGLLDLVVLNWDGAGYVTVLLGNGDGSFGPPITTVLDDTAGFLAVADFNADGRPDAAVTRSNPSRVSVLLNDGSWSPDDPPSVSIRDASVTEGNTGTASATFTVTLSRATNVDVTVHYATADVTATAGSDYTAASGTVTIPAGQTSATVTVAVKGDRLGEANEAFAVNLTAATGATIGDGQGIVTIFDNEPRISISDVTKSEGRKNKRPQFTFTVTLSAPYDQPVTVSFRTVNGTATTGDNDYVAKSGTLTFAPGETTKTITIEVKGDNKREGNETFYLDLFDNSSNSLLVDWRGIGTIRNDD
jgi:hypothetical protein